MKYFFKQIEKTIAWYITDIWKEQDIPEGAVETTDEKYKEALKINANFFDGTNFIVKDFRTDKELEESRVSSIKAKAGEIITSRYDIIKQMNIYGEGGEAQLEMITWIKKIRDISNKAEADGTALADIIWE